MKLQFFPREFARVWQTRYKAYVYIKNENKTWKRFKLSFEKIELNFEKFIKFIRRFVYLKKKE